MADGLNAPPQIDAFGMLLARLDWPLRPVRLMASRRLGELLKDDDAGERQAQFLHWLSSRETETEIINGLVVLALTGTPPVISMTDIVASTNCPSILADMYLAQIYDLHTQDILWTSATSGPAPLGFEADDKFLKGIGTHAAPVFVMTFENIEKQNGFPFMKQWAWEYDNIPISETRYSPSPGYFTDHSREPTRGDFEGRQSEVYRSSFLRTLHHAVAEWEMPIHRAAHIAEMAAPANIDLARVEPSSPPTGWPTFEQDADADAAITEETAIRFISPLQAENDGEILVAANGHIYASKQRWIELEYACGFFEENVSENPTEILQALNAYVAPLPTLGIPPSLQASDVKNYREELGAGIYPAAIHLIPNNWPRSHFMMLARGVFSPSPEALGNEVQCSVEGDSIVYEMEGRPVGRWIYWHTPWSDSWPEATGGAIGTALLMNEDFIDLMQGQVGGVLRQCYEFRRHYRDNEYGEWELDMIKGFVQ